MSETVVALEGAELKACADVYRAASPEVVSAAGLSVTDIGDAILIAAKQIDVLALNRLLGLGLRGPVLD